MEKTFELIQNGGRRAITPQNLLFLEDYWSYRDVVFEQVHYKYI